MKLDRDRLMRLIQQHFDLEGQKVLTFTRWKDGIDVQYTTFAIEALAESIREDAMVECAEIAEGLDDCTGAFIGQKLRDLAVTGQ